MTGSARPLLPRRANLCIRLGMAKDSASQDLGISTEHPGFSRRFAAIVGAPRTGTTALSRFLRKHPAVCFSKVKEPHFFSQWDLTQVPDDELRHAVGKEYLERYFPNCGDGKAMLMEGSVTYLYAPEQMTPILKLWPDAKFIIGLRDPMDMIPSLHQRLLVLGDETEEDLEKAWDLVEERKHGREIPKSCVEPRWLRYDEVGKLGSYVERFIEVVGRERCYFSLYDDLKADPAGAYRDALDFLGLPHVGQVDEAPRRVRRGYKYAWLQRLLMRPPGVTRKIMAGAPYRRRVEAVEKLRGKKSATLRLIERARKALLKWNQADAPPVRMSPRLRKEIAAHYRANVDRLGEILGRDLSHWLAERP